MTLGEESRKVTYFRERALLASVLRAVATIFYLPFKLQTQQKLPQYILSLDVSWAGLELSIARWQKLSFTLFPIPHSYFSTQLQLVSYLPVSTFIPNAVHSTYQLSSRRVKQHLYTSKPVLLRSLSDHDTLLKILQRFLFHFPRT